MSVPFDDFWKWARTAPLPVVLALVLALSGWVYVIASEQVVERADLDNVTRQVDRMDQKLDRLLDGMADLKAEQRQVRTDSLILQQAPTAPAKEKTR